MRQKLSKKIGNKHKLANLELFVNIKDFEQVKNKFKHQNKKLQSSTNNRPDPELTLSHVSNIVGW